MNSYKGVSKMIKLVLGLQSQFPTPNQEDYYPEYRIEIILLILTLVLLILFIKIVRPTKKVDLVKIIISVISFFILVLGYCTDIANSVLYCWVDTSKPLPSYSPCVSNDVLTTSFIINLFVVVLGLMIQPIRYRKNRDCLQNSNRQNKYLILYFILLTIVGMILGGLNNSLRFELDVVPLLFVLGVNSIVLFLQSLIQVFLIKKLIKQQTKSK